MSRTCCLRVRKLLPGTSWFKLNAPNCDRHECRLQCLPECHIWYHMQYLLECRTFGVVLTAINSGRGWHSQLFSWGPRAGANGENVSRPTTDLDNKGQPQSGVSEGIILLFMFFSERADSRYSKKCLYYSSPKFSKILLRNDNNIKSYLTPKVGPMLKLSNYKATTQIPHVSALKFRRQRRFWEVEPDTLHTFHEPLSTR